MTKKCEKQSEVSILDKKTLGSFTYVLAATPYGETSKSIAIYECKLDIDNQKYLSLIHTVYGNRVKLVDPTIIPYSEGHRLNNFPALQVLLELVFPNYEK